MAYGSSAAIYTLECETADKTDTLSIGGTAETDVISFVLPESMSETAQRTWTCILKMDFTDESIIDYSLYTFEIQITKSTSSNTR